MWLSSGIRTFDERGLNAVNGRVQIGDKRDPNALEIVWHAQSEVALVVGRTVRIAKVTGDRSSLKRYLIASIDCDGNRFSQSANNSKTK